MTDQPARQPNRRLLLAGGAFALVVLLVVGFLVFRGGTDDAEQEDLAQQWQSDLGDWAQQAVDRIGPDGTDHPRTTGHDLTEHFDPQLTEPVRDPGAAPVAAEAVDEVNASCTATTVLVEVVEDMVEPPAPPDGLDTDHHAAQSAAQDFQAARNALADYREQIGDAGAQLRGFCGTYPALLTVHFNAAQSANTLSDLVTCTEETCEVQVDGDSDLQWMTEVATAAVIEPNEVLAEQGLPACYLESMVDVCQADAQVAASLAEVWSDWPQQLRTDPDAAARTMAEAQEVEDGTEEDREQIREAAEQELTGLVEALDHTAADFEQALSPVISGQ